MATDYLSKYRENSPRMAINWSSDNPKLKCKEDVFVGPTWFQKGKEYQIYRVTYLEQYPYGTGDKIWFFYILNPDYSNVQPTSQPTTFLSREQDGLKSVYDCFENVDQVMRKVKLERLNEIDESGLYS